MGLVAGGTAATVAAAGLAGSGVSLAAENVLGGGANTPGSVSETNGVPVPFAKPSGIGEILADLVAPIDPPFRAAVAATDPAYAALLSNWATPTSSAAATSDSTPSSTGIATGSTPAASTPVSYPSRPAVTPLVGATKAANALGAGTGATSVAAPSGASATDLTSSGAT